MRKPFRHVGVLMIMGIAALGLIAAAYTLWYEDLSVTANVTTAQFDVDWSCQTGFTSGAGTGATANQNCGSATKETVAILTSPATTSNPSLTWASFTDEGGSVAASKYIQDCSAAIGDAASAANGNTGEDNTLTLTMNNLYPFAGCKFALDIDVPDGSYVPAHFTLTAESNNSAGTVKVLAKETGACTQIAGILNSASTSTATPITTDGSAPLQLHANEHLYCTFLVYLQELNNSNATVAEGATFQITATIKAHQFNEPIATTTP